MNCPKCISPMEKVTFTDVEVDRCTDCQGIFFDEFEKEQLQKSRGASAIDIGDAKLGKEFNKVDRINCPRCGSLMIRMVDLNQRHICDTSGSSTAPCVADHSLMRASFVT